jgi:hypothetical protein
MALRAVLVGWFSVWALGQCLFLILFAATALWRWLFTVPVVSDLAAAASTAYYTRYRVELLVTVSMIAWWIVFAIAGRVVARLHRPQGLAFAIMFAATAMIYNVPRFAWWAFDPVSRAAPHFVFVLPLYLLFDVGIPCAIVLGALRPN